MRSIAQDFAPCHNPKPEYIRAATPLSFALWGLICDTCPQPLEQDRQQAVICYPPISTSQLSETEVQLLPSPSHPQAESMGWTLHMRRGQQEMAMSLPCFSLQGRGPATQPALNSGWVEPRSTAPFMLQVCGHPAPSIALCKYTQSPVMSQ